MTTETAQRFAPLKTDTPSVLQVAAPTVQDADRNTRHSDDPQADRVSRITDLVLTAATGLTFFYVDPVSPIIGAAFAAAFGNKEIIVLTGQPKLASLLTTPYAKATCTAASIVLFPFYPTIASLSLGCLMCCRLQRTSREPARTAPASAPKPDPRLQKKLY